VVDAVWDPIRRSWGETVWQTMKTLEARAEMAEAELAQSRGEREVAFQRAYEQAQARVAELEADVVTLVSLLEKQGYIVVHKPFIRSDGTRHTYGLAGPTRQEHKRIAELEKELGDWRGARNAMAEVCQRERALADELGRALDEHDLCQSGICLACETVARWKQARRSGAQGEDS
jgi:hypothetical protein